MPAQQNNLTCNTTCIYGESRTGKTREIGSIARYVFQKTGKLTRLIFLDGGGFEVIQPEIDAGLIIPLRLTGHGDVGNWLHALSQGYWPKDNTLQGGLVKFSDHPQAVEIGCYAIEGISAICQEYLQWLVQKGIKVNSDVVGKQKIKPGESNQDAALDINLGAASEGHYGIVGQELFRLIRNFQKLAEFGIQDLIWTSLEAGGEEKIAGMRRSVIGVGAIGKAITPMLPAKFGDLFHFERDVDAKGRIEYRCYFQSHEDKELGGRTWPASMRLSPQASDALSKDPAFSKGYLVLTDEDGSPAREGIARILKWRDGQKASAVEALKEMMASRRVATNA